MMKHAQTKELKLQQQEQKYKQKYEAEMLKNLNIWHSHIIPNWDSVRYCERTIKLWSKGIPTRLRGVIWPKAVGNSLRINIDTYEICKQRAREALIARQKHEMEGYEENPSFVLLGREDTVALIENDISRTFPQLGLFQEKGPLALPLTHVLSAFACYRADIGYVQGMSFLAAMLLLNMDELTAFQTLCHMFKHKNGVLTSFYKMDLGKIHAYFKVFHHFLNHFAPLLFNHFDTLGLLPEFYLYEWFLSMFSKPLPLDVAHRVWDLHFCFGDVSLFRIGLGLLCFYETRLCGLGFEEAITDVLKLPSKMVTRKDEEAFWDFLENRIKIDRDVYASCCKSVGIDLFF